MRERSFETRLEEAYGRYTAGSSVGVDVEAVADDVLANRRRSADGTTRVPRDRGFSFPRGETARTLAIAATLAMLLFAIVAISLLGGSQPKAPLGDAGPSRLPASSAAVAQPAPTVTNLPVLAREPWVVYTDQIGAVNTDRLWLVRPDGSDRHQLATGLDGEQEHPDWSHDGDQIAIDRAIPGSATQSGDPRRDLWVLRADGSGARPIASCSSPCYQLAYPSWSPDDRTIVVSRFEELQSNTWGKGAIEVIDVATGSRRTVLESADGSVDYHSPRFSPDGSEIVFTLETFSDDTASQRVVSTRIAIVRTDGSSAAPRLITPTELDADEPDWNRVDGRILFHTHFDIGDLSTRTKPTELMTVRSDGTDLAPVTSFGLGARRAIGATWTPDGRRIVFTLVDGFGGEQIPTIAFIGGDGTGLTRLGFGTGSGPRLRPTSPTSP